MSGAGGPTTYVTLPEALKARPTFPSWCSSAPTAPPGSTVTSAPRERREKPTCGGRPFAQAPCVGAQNPEQDRGGTFWTAPGQGARPVLAPRTYPQIPDLPDVAPMALAVVQHLQHEVDEEEDEASPARAGSRHRHTPPPPPAPVLAGLPRAGRDRQKWGPSLISKGPCSASLGCRPAQAAADGGPGGLPRPGPADSGYSHSGVRLGEPCAGRGRTSS